MRSDFGGARLARGQDRPFDPHDPVAFLAPNIVKAAIEGRLPRGFGLKRLVDLPIAWPDQWRALGLEAPAPHKHDQPFGAVQ